VGARGHECIVTFDNRTADVVELLREMCTNVYFFSNRVFADFDATGMNEGAILVHDCRRFCQPVKFVFACVGSGTKDSTLSSVYRETLKFKSLFKELHAIVFTKDNLLGANQGDVIVDSLHLNASVFTYFF
jgi:hypothetical protein